MNDNCEILLLNTMGDEIIMIKWNEFNSSFSFSKNTSINSYV